ncbi:glycosyltransferase family 2 protein [Candidatus Microgenomates bacterium]|nr:glycosyltransferase family 2 protein [Candidatus Microgenomates bacterium]
MANKILISVVMPAHNAESFIAQAIESMLQQTFSEFELIIIDDCSNDKTGQIAWSYAKKDSRIRVYRNKKNLNIAGTLNRGIKLSKADFIARMDADDISSPERLKIQYKLLSKRKKLAIVGANMEIIDENDQKISKRDYPTKSADLKRVMFKYSPFAHPVVMFKKSAVLEFGGYDEEKVPCEDIDLWFKLGSKYNFASIDKYLLGYRVLPDSLSKYDLKYLEKLGFSIKLNAIKKHGYTPRVYDVVYNLAQFVTLWMPAKSRIAIFDFFRSRGII